MPFSEIFQKIFLKKFRQARTKKCLFNEWLAGSWLAVNVQLVLACSAKRFFFFGLYCTGACWQTDDPTRPNQALSRLDNRAQ